MDRKAKRVEAMSSATKTKNFCQNLSERVIKSISIFEDTLKKVRACPTDSDYRERASKTCGGCCENILQDGNCAYHCMRDTSKTNLLEFCATPKTLFDYCPEYDPKGKRIQKDTDTWCNSSSSVRYYNSSDLFHCDPENCLQLYGDSQNTKGTTMITYWDIYKTLIFVSSIIAFIALTVLMIYIFRKRFRVWFSLCMRRNNPTEVIIPLSNLNEKNRYLERRIWTPEDSVNCPNYGQCKPLCDDMDLGQLSSISTSNLNLHDSNSTNLTTNFDRKNNQTDTDIK